MMNYYQKYNKYKNKYLLLKQKINNKNGGKFEGIGSYGLVMSTPRLPLMGEKYVDIKDLNQVSKILYSYDKTTNKYIPATEDNFNKEYFDIIALRDKYPDVFTDTNFILPLNGGMVNIGAFISSGAYNNDWTDNDDMVKKMIYELFIINRYATYQIVYNKGEVVESLCKTNIDFANLMSRPIRSVNNANNHNIFFKDMKMDNMIYQDNKIKIADFSDIVDLNQYSI
jgi:hypothetical protein